MIKNTMQKSSHRLFNIASYFQCQEQHIIGTAKTSGKYINCIK